jgi:hypothetical protein
MPERDDLHTNQEGEEVEYALQQELRYKAFKYNKTLITPAKVFKNCIYNITAHELKNSTLMYVHIVLKFLRTLRSPARCNFF